MKGPLSHKRLRRQIIAKPATISTVRSICGLALLASLALASTSALAQMGSWGVAQGIGSVINQAGGAVTKKLFSNKNKLVDISAEREKFFGAVEAQSASLDPAARTSLMGTMESQWASVEMSLLLANAQAVSERKAPAFDLKQVALDVAEGTLLQSQMVGIAGGSNVTEMLGSAALKGIVDGAQGDQEASEPQQSSAIPLPVDVSLSITDAVTAAAGSVAAVGVQEVVAGAVEGALAPDENVAGALQLTEDLDPSTFLGRPPAELNQADLYRENGFIGWKRIEQTDVAQVYAPVMPDKVIKAAVFSSDPTTRRVVSAFRIVNASVASFGPLVAQIAEREKHSPKYASSGSSLRAVWPSGVFLTADGSQLFLGWSQQAARMFAEVSASASPADAG